jgi:transcription termination/antitermination protein NusG
MGLRWFIVHTHSGFENKVAAAIKEQAQKKAMESNFAEVFVPTEGVVEVKRGKKVSRDRKFFPGYVLVKMEMNDESWHLVKNIPKVTGFLGGGGSKPQPISDRDAESIFARVKEGVDSPRHTVVFEVGESVKVTEGPFESFIGVVEELDETHNKLKVAVSIFGRATPVELEYSQVEKA